jgi:hypothetical protein
MKSGRRGSNPRQLAWEARTLPLSYSRTSISYHSWMSLSRHFSLFFGRYEGGLREGLTNGYNEEALINLAFSELYFSEGVST